MNEHTVNPSDVSIGLDLGDRHSAICVFDRATGEIVEESRIPTKADSLRRRFQLESPVRVALEVGAQSPWISRLLVELGHEVVVANPRKLRLIYENDNKSDRVDAEYLARLAAADPKLLHPVEHGSEQVQCDRALLKARDRLLECQKKLVNAVRGMAKSLGCRLPACSTNAFPRRVRELIPEALRPAVDPLLEALEELRRQALHYEREVKRLCEERYPSTRLLQQVPGVGPITALDYVLTIDNPTRFSKSRTVGAYVGLRPARKESGRASPELHITKAGNPMLRRHLVNCAHYILGPFGPDCDLRRWGLELASRGNKTAKKTAVIAVARKLAVLLHRLWTSQQAYEPIRLGV